MPFSRRVTRTVLAFFATTFFVHSASAKECLQARALINTLSVRATGDAPCDLFGTIYLMGLGEAEPQFVHLPGIIPDEYVYYELVRAFLSENLHPEHSTDADRFGFLLAALTYLVDDGSERYRAYSYFILAEYWRLNAPDIKYSATTLDNVLGLFTAPGAIKTEQELKCFIRADYPIFPIEEILKTPVFESCMRAE